MGKATRDTRKRLNREAKEYGAGYSPKYGWKVRRGYNPVKEFEKQETARKSLERQYASEDRGSGGRRGPISHRPGGK